MILNQARNLLTHDPRLSIKFVLEKMGLFLTDGNVALKKIKTGGRIPVITLKAAESWIASSSKRNVFLGVVDTLPALWLSNSKEMLLEAVVADIEEISPDILTKITEKARNKCLPDFSDSDDTPISFI